MPNDPVTFLGMSEPAFRIIIFVTAFLVFSILEALLPKRPRNQTRLQRWTTNTGMLLIATGLVRLVALLAPLVAMTVAATLAINLGFGLFNLIELPILLEIILAVALLDLAIWFQHLVSHKVPFLWRFHRVHHADRDLDASSALRFHPIEIVASAFYKLCIVFILGPSVIAAVLFEVILNASAMFNHANLAMSRSFEQTLRLAFVTPDMHRVHHSIYRHEHDTNFGFCLSIWDRLFGTYTSQPQNGHQEMVLGLADQQTEKTAALGWSLKLPLMRL